MRLLYGLELRECDLELLRASTHRSDDGLRALSATGKHAAEIWIRVGRRGRKSLSAALIATHEAAFAQGLLTLLGAASEASGLDRVLKTNTVKKRTHSLFRQGSYWYLALPNLREDRLRPLMEAFGKIVADHEVSRELLGFI